MIKNSLITPYLHDTYTILDGKQHLHKELESFLSCSAIISNSYPRSIDNIYFGNPLISNTYKKSYRASLPPTRYLNDNLRPLDGISGPEFQDTMFILGIDPGVSGAVAVLKINLDTLQFVAAYDLPTYTLKVSGKDRRRLDLTGLANLLDMYSRNTKFAMIEDVSSQPTDGHVGAFTFGFATGAVHGALAMAGVKIEKVKPAVWKAFFGLDSDKDKSFKLALKLFPEAQKYLKRKMDHGRAEAILLAWFAFKHMRKR